jgi:soluble lytic murein transglycosylase-like protein
MTKHELQAVAVSIALDFGLDPALVCAVCHHESGNWNPWAIRYEPGFYHRYIDSMKGLSDTEKQARACSWGLMQVMGQVAREQGFDGPYLSELCDPRQNIRHGCKKLAKCLDRANGDVRTALLGYNGGGNPGYPDKVLRHLKEYQ